MDYEDSTRQRCDLLHKGAERLETIIKEIRDTSEALRDDKSQNPATVAKVYFSVREAYEELDKQRKGLYHVKDFMEKCVLPEAMQNADTDQVRVPSLARSFSLQTKMSASFIDKQAGVAWLRESGNGDIVQETVNAQTLTALCRNMILEEGIEPPTDLVRVNSYNTVGVTKYTPKAGK